MEYFSKYFLNVVKNKYAQFDGRADRPEFWYYTLFSFIIAIVTGIIDGILGISLLGVLFALALLIPNIAIGIRRLHDINKSGWWLLIALIPFIGVLVLIAFYVMPSDPNDNQYGSRPLPTEI